MSPEIHESLKAAYEDVAYVGGPNPCSQPSRLAAVAALFGLDAPDPSTARVLGEVMRRRRAAARLLRDFFMMGMR